MSLDNARSINSISKRLGIPSNYFQSIKSLRASCRYLTHIDFDDKIQYNLSDVIVSPSFSRKFYSSFDDLKTEQDIIDDIYLYIDSLTNLTFKDALKHLILFVNSQSYDTIYKIYRNEFIDYLKLSL